MFGVHMGWADITTAAPIAEQAALAAIMADSEDPWAHNALGSVYFSTRRLDNSLAEFELALQLNPNFSLALGYYGLALCYCGRWQEASEAALRGDFSGAYRVLTVAAGMAGQTEVATAALQELRRAQPNISLAWIANALPWKREADREHYLEAFRRAGLD